MRKQCSTPARVMATCINVVRAVLSGALETKYLTINGSGGNRSDDLNWKSSQLLIHNLSDIVNKDGDYLPNVGLTADGVIPQPEVERLLAIGKWLKTNGEAVYGTRGSPFAQLRASLRATQKANANGGTAVYLHVWEWPSDDKLVQPGIRQAAAGGSNCQRNS